MGKDIDWKETEWLVTQLRAKLAEDQQSEEGDEKPTGDTVGNPSAKAIPPDKGTQEKVRKKKKKHHKEHQSPKEPDLVKASVSASVEKSAEKAVAATRAEEITSVEAVPAAAAPVEEEPTEVAPATTVSDEAAAPVDAEPVEAAFAETAAIEENVEQLDRDDMSAEEQSVDAPEQTETVTPDAEAGQKSEETAEENSAAPAEADPLPAYAVLPQKRTALFSASYDQDLSVPYQAAAPHGKGKTSKKKAAPAHQPRTDQEKRAEVTVEHLMQDLFGAESLTWFSADRQDGSDDAPPKAPEMKPAAAASADTKKGSVRESVPASKKKESRKAAKEQKTAFDTITRETDGQMALVLPETGKPLAIASGEYEHHSSRDGHREERRTAVGDEAQIDLFSAEGGSAALAADPKQDKFDFKRSIEASEEDFQLLLDLDYEDELGSAIGFEKIRAYHEEGVNGQPVVKRRRRLADRREYGVQGQDTSLRKYYNKQKGEHVVRLALSVLLTLLIMIYENSSWMAVLFGGFLDGEQYPATYILIGIQLLIIAALFQYQRLWEGFLHILRFSPIDYSLCSVMLIATVVYHVVLIFLPHEVAPVLYLSPAAMSLVLLALADLLDWYRESLAFQVVSSRKQKFALIPRVSVGGKQGNARSSLTDDDIAGTVWYVRPVGFIRNYFANTEKRIGHGRTLGMQLLLILSIGVAFGWYAFAVGGTAEKMVQTVFVTFLLCVPVTSLLITSLPMFFAACLRLGKKGAIIGEEPVYRCGGTTTLVLPDSEVFGAMHHEQFEVLDEEHYDRITVLVRALLEKVQSPLCDSLNVERDRRIPPSKVTLDEIEQDGIRATVGEERIEMLLGSAEYMKSHGVDILSRIGHEPEYGGKRLVCVAASGRPVAFFLARYRLNDSMSDLLRDMETEGVRVMIRTKDPGIRDDLFESLLPDRREQVSVMKPTAREIDLRTDRVDATVVALGSCREASRTFVTCRRVRRAANFGKLFQVLSVTVGGLIAALLTFIGGSVGISPFLVSVYLLFWGVTHAATSYFFLRKRDDE